MPHVYKDFLSPNAGFQRAVNLSLDLGELSFVENYIPTKASCQILHTYCQSIILPKYKRASVLIGPYGKGKSYALFVLAEFLSAYGNGAEKALSSLAKRVGEIDRETAELLQRIRSQKIRMLPVVINDRYLDVRQAFLASLRSALDNAGLDELMPDNYFEQCLLTIARWQENYPETHKAYTVFLRSLGLHAFDFENALRQYDPKSMELFRSCYRTILAGAEFDPLLESDVPTLYAHVAQALQSKTDYSGLLIIFDEFSKYLEAAFSGHGQPQFKILQDLAELCDRSDVPRMLMTCVSHKAIGEYASHLPPSGQSSFKTVEGRFTPIYFTSSFEGSFSLIAGALGRNRRGYQEFIKEHAQAHARTASTCEALGCFSGYESTVEQIVDQCFPMHPLTCFSLMKLSEKVAQNERTFFTFLSDQDSPLAKLIRGNSAAYELLAIDCVYDYFHTAIREELYNPALRGMAIRADALLTAVCEDEARLVKAIVLFSMIADSGVLATRAILQAGLGWDDERLKQALTRLEQAHHAYVRRSDGVLCLMRSSTDSIYKDIEAERSNGKDRIDIADQLSGLIDPGYTIPRRYNDQHEIVRFFRNVFMTADRFMKQSGTSWIDERGFADGYVIYLLGGDLSAADVQGKLKQWDRDDVLVLMPETSFLFRDEVEECAAIDRLLAQVEDEITAEELTYYYDDLLQLVQRQFAEMFDGHPFCVTARAGRACQSVGSEVSCLCEETLYPRTPLICHEMLNRTELTGIMKQIRGKVIDAILEKDDPLQGFAPKTAEASVMRAVLSQWDDVRMQEVIGIIRAFMDQCVGTKQPIGSLYHRLMSPPYGMRKGLLPILLAIVLKERLNQAVLYYLQQEMPICGETFKALDEHAAEFYIAVDRGNADQFAYLQILHDVFTPNDATSKPVNLHDAMSRMIRALPRCARTNRKVITSSGAIADIPLSWIEVRNVLLRFGGNSHETILTKLPAAIGMPATKYCASSICTAYENFKGYLSSTMKALVSITRKRFGASERTSLHGAMIAWIQAQPHRSLDRAFDAEAAALLAVIRLQEDHTDEEWINRFAIALTSLPVEDWSDQQLEAYPGLLSRALSQLEETHSSVQEEANAGSYIAVTLGNSTICQSLHGTELEGMAKVAYHSMRSTMEEFSDSLSTTDKLLVLANLLLRMNERE